MSRFAALNYDSVCGGKQKALRLVFLALELSIEQNINRPADVKAISTEPWNKAFAYADEHFKTTRGYQRGKNAMELGYNIYMNSTDKELALDSLELSYMWLGKGIRDEQLSRLPKA